MNATPGLTLDQVIDYMIKNNINDARIYEYLTLPADITAINACLASIDQIDGQPKPNGMKKKTWEGQKNQQKGACFEQLTGLVLQTVKPFKSWDKVHTTTNEIDWLIQMGPTALHLPTMREWGTHCLCECKIGNESVNVTWIGKLNTLLQTSGASVGLLISRKGIPTKGSSSARFQLQLLAAQTPSRVIISIDLEEMKESVQNRRFLQLISTRFIEVK